MPFTSDEITSNRRTIALGALAALVVAGAVVAAVGAGQRHDTKGAASSGPAAASTTIPAANAASRAVGAPERSADAKSSAASAPTESSGTTASPLVGPQVVRTADLQVKVKGSFDAAVDRATSLAGQLGGFVTSSSSSFLDGRESGDLTLRIPAARFDEARRRLGELGTLESSQIGGNDVGGQLVDLDARLRTLHTEEDALDDLLGRSTDIGQILQVRDRLTGVRTEIEQLAGQQAALKDQVALATIHVVLHEPGSSSVPQPKPVHAWDLGRSLRSSYHATLAVVGGMVIVLGALLPVLVLAALGLPFAIRYRNRRRAATV